MHQDIETTRKLAGVDVGIIQHLSIREEQQDAFFAVESNPRDPQLIGALLRDRFAKVEKKTTGYKYSGATATVAVLSPDNQLTLAHLGDCSAILYIRNRTTGEITCKELSHPHSLEDPKEQARIKAVRGDIIPRRDTKSGITQLRLGGKLNGSRAFGDNSLKGIFHEPDVTPIDLTEYLTPENQVFLCMASDGMCASYPKATAEDYIPVIKETYKDGTDNHAQAAALAIATHAYQAKMIKDNKTVLFTELSKPRNGKELILGVFDGHDISGSGTEPKGAEISNLAARTLEQSLVNTIPQPEQRHGLFGFLPRIRHR